MKNLFLLIFYRLTYFELSVNQKQLALCVRIKNEYEFTN